VKAGNLNDALEAHASHRLVGYLQEIEIRFERRESTRVNEQRRANILIGRKALQFRLQNGDEIQCRTGLRDMETNAVPHQLVMCKGA